MGRIPEKKTKGERTLIVIAKITCLWDGTITEKSW
jgi:hypothetical protein